MSSKLIFTFLFIVYSSLFYAQNATINSKEIDSIIQNIDTIQFASDKINVISAYAGNHRYAKSTRAIIEKAMDIANESNDLEVFGNSFYLLGNYYYFNTELDSSFIFLEKAENYIVNLNLPFLKASILTTKSGIYNKKGDVSSAIYTKLEAKNILENIDTLKISKKEKFKLKGKRLVLNNSLANLYNQMEDYETALVYYEDAYQNALKLNSKINAGVILSNKGDLLIKTGRFEEALDILQQSKLIKIEGNAPKRLIAASDLNIGMAYHKLEEYEEALKYLNNSFHIFTEINNTSGLTEVLTERGILFNKQEKYSLAKEDCEKAKTLSIQLQDIDYQLKSCGCLFEAYKGLGEFQKSLENHELFLKTKDSIFNKKNIKKLTQLQMQYEFDKKENLQKIEVEKREQERIFFIYLSIAGILITLVLGFSFIKNRKKNILLAKQKKLLEISVDEKNVLLKETHHRVKNSFQIVSSLLYLQSESIANKEAKIAIKEAQNRVRSMVLIHQKLYSKDQLVGINALEYITDLTKDIMESHQFQSNSLNYTIDVDSIVLDINTITPIGLILNELIVNVLKHAYPEIDETSLLAISLHKKGQELTLQVHDNGKGFIGEIKETSFGIKLINALSKKLKATLQYENLNNQGTKATLTIKRFNII